MADKIMKTLNGYEVYDEYARTQLDSKFDKSGGTVTGSILSDDAYMYDIGSSTNPFSIVYAGTFSGDLSGNATTATTASSCTGNAATATTASACSGNSATATKLAAAKTISLTGDVTGSTSFDGSGNVSITATVADNSHAHAISDVTNLQSTLDGKASSGHTHAGLVNGTYTNGVVNLLYADSDTFTLVPRASGGSTVEVYLGDNSCRYAGTYTDFVVATNGIQADSGNIVATNGRVQAKTQVYSEDKLTADGALAVGGAATIDGTLDIGGVVTTTLRIVPAVNNNVNLGLSSLRWMNIYSASSVNVSSDLTVKTDISEIDDRYIELFDLVQPYTYKFIDGNSGRVHTGFISQYVEAAMEQVGLKDADLAFFCKDALYEEVKDEDGNVIGEEPILDEDGNQKYFYSLRYEEYIAIMTEKIKRMEKRIDELETKLEKVDEIEARLAALETA